MWNYCAAGFPPRFFGMPLGVVSMVLLVLLAVAVFRLLTKKNAAPEERGRFVNTDREDSLHILKVRLAKGEIGVEEFDRLKNYL